MFRTALDLKVICPVSRHPPEREGVPDNSLHTADELGHCELLTDQQRQHDADLRHQVGGRDLEDHGNCEVSASRRTWLEASGVNVISA